MMNTLRKCGWILTILTGAMLLCACRKDERADRQAMPSASESTVRETDSMEPNEPEQTDAREAQTDSAEGEENEANMANIYVTVNDTVLTAKLASNSSAEALVKKLQSGDITIDMHDYASFEKVGSLGFSLPRNDRNYTTKAGDIILYQGDQLVFYYDTNSWSFTKLGEFQDIDQQGLKSAFGDGGITATLSLEKR